MLIGTEIIVMSAEDAEKLLKAIREDWSRDRIERLSKMGVLDAVNRLHEATKRLDDVLYRSDIN